MIQCWVCGKWLQNYGDHGTLGGRQACWHCIDEADEGARAKRHALGIPAAGRHAGIMTGMATTARARKRRLL